jgi:hypothetical protein
MVRGTYILDLWCESGMEHPYIVKGDIYGFPQTYRATTANIARTNAHRAGWTLTPKPICPLCNGKVKNMCNTCNCTLNNQTTGIVIIEKDGTRKTVCDECNKDAIRDGWIEITRAK